MALMCVSPLLGELGIETAWDLTAQQDQHPSSIVRLLPTGCLFPMKKLLPTWVLSLVEAKEAGKRGTSTGVAAQGARAVPSPGQAEEAQPRC